HLVGRCSTLVSLVLSATPWRGMVLRCGGWVGGLGRGRLLGAPAQIVDATGVLPSRYILGNHEPPDSLSLLFHFAPPLSLPSLPSPLPLPTFPLLGDYFKRQQQQQQQQQLSSHKQEPRPAPAVTPARHKARGLTRWWRRAGSLP